MGMATALVSQCFSEATCLSHLLHISSSLNVWEGRFVSKKGMFRIKFQNSQCRLSSPLPIGIWFFVRLGEGHRLLEYEIWSTGDSWGYLSECLDENWGPIHGHAKALFGWGLSPAKSCAPLFSLQNKLGLYATSRARHPPAMLTQTMACCRTSAQHSITINICNHIYIYIDCEQLRWDQNHETIAAKNVLLASFQLANALRWTQPSDESHLPQSNTKDQSSNHSHLGAEKILPSLATTEPTKQKSETAAVTQNHSRFCPWRSTCLGIKPQQIHQSVSGLNKTLYQVDTCGFFPCLHHNQAHLAIFVVSARNEKNIGTSEIVIFTVNDSGPKHFIISAVKLLCWSIHHNLAQQKTFRTFHWLSN